MSLLRQSKSKIVPDLARQLWPASLSAISRLSTRVIFDRSAAESALSLFSPSYTSRVPHFGYTLSTAVLSRQHSDDSRRNVAADGQIHVRSQAQPKSDLCRQRSLDTTEDAVFGG